MSEVVIKHYGKRGMKWGVRSAKSTSSSEKGSKSKKELTPEQKTAAKEGLKSTAKTVAKIAVRGSLVAGLTAIGVPVAVAGASIAALETASPAVIQAGKLYAEGLLPEAGLQRFSALNQFRIGLVAGRQGMQESMKE